MDLVCRVPWLPRAGETVLGTRFAVIPGGKGANQAVAAARLGGEVHMIGRVGEDEFGRQLLAGLRANGVKADHVLATPGVASGCAAISVDDAGENSIAVVPGANGLLLPADVDAAEGLTSVHSGSVTHVAPFVVKVVDTTAAGDAFTGALAVGLAEGMSLPAAARFANAAGALCCTRFGAQPALPMRDAAEKLRSS